MVAGTDQIHQGMDVYGSDGEKIGSVDSLYGADTPSGQSGGTDTGPSNTYSGVLGDESRVGTDNASRTFGDESGAARENDTRTFGDESAGTSSNRSRTFGDESGVDPDMETRTFGDESSAGTVNRSRTFGDDSAAATPYSNAESDADPGAGSAYANPEYTETDVVIVEGTLVSGAEYTSGGYFTVKHGGVLGIGGHELYIPFSAVADVNAAENRITLNATGDEAAGQYANQPPGATQG